MQKTAHVLGRLGSWQHPAAVALREVIMKTGWERGAFKNVETKEIAYGTRWRQGAVSAR
jgi:hypothetical protein